MKLLYHLYKSQVTMERHTV